uniref:Transcription cofactor vestigial-like protein 1 n=1 Tax=Pogona vitticeps TaxID=103695 RepID=A0ABM5EW38_9SAUR
MEDGKDNSAKLSRSKQPVKTEWGAQYVVFTYFQGDINSVVDEHFSRALSTTKIPQDLSRKSSSEDAVVKNETHMRPSSWTFSPHWTKPYQTPSALNLSGSEENAAAGPGISPCPSSVLQGIPPPTMTELWHMSPGPHPSLTAAPGYPPSVPDLHMAQGPVPEGKYRGSLLGLLRQESCSGSTQEPSTSGSTCLSGSARLQNTSQGFTSAGGIPANDRRRDLFF